MSEWKETEFGLIPFDWQELTVNDLVEKEIIYKPLDGNHGSIHPKGTDFVSEGIPFIMASDIIDGKVDLANCSFISEEQAKKLQKGFSYTNDVLLTHKASLGRTAIVGNLSTPFIMLTPQVTYYRVKDYSKLNNIFLKYFFDSPAFQGILENHGSSGSTRAYIGITSQRELPILLPKIETQRAIASILSSLDDKIDLLHRQNATLEKMAETLFRQWFVEEVKEEWEKGKLDDLVVVNYGKDHKSLLEGNIPVYGSGGLMRTVNKALYCKESVLIPRKGSLNNVIYIDKPFWTVDTMFYTEMKKPNLAKFIYHFVKKLDLASMNVGSAVPSMTTEVLKNVPINIPSDSFFEKFENAVFPFYNKIKINHTQIRTLTNLRDTLLPKLMSGEVRVKI